MIRRRKWHQIVFALAGAYNVFWGVYTVFDPQWFFRFAGLEPINHPAIFSCLGMVIGLYGLLYWKVAQRPETGFEIAVVGFFGKVAGPIGMAYLVSKGDWPAKAALLCVTNDLIWLIPFGIYFADYLRFYKRANE